MKKTQTLFSFLILMFVALNFSVAHANEGRVGNSYISGGVLFSWFDDNELNEFYGSTPSASLEINFNIHKNIDLSAAVGRRKASGSFDGYSIETTIDSSTFSARFFQRNEKIIFFGGTSYTFLKVEDQETIANESHTESNSDTSHGFFAGLEILLPQNIFADVSVSRDFYGDGEKSTTLTIGLGSWVSKNIFTRILGSYSADDFDFFSIGFDLGYSF